MIARLLTTLLLTLAVAWVAPAPAHACGCAYDEHDPELVRRAEVIFTGTVVRDRRFGDTRTLTFTVERVYKGQAASTQDVKTHVLGATCGLELAGDGPFLIQAGTDPDLTWLPLAGGLTAIAVATILALTRGRRR